MSQVSQLPHSCQQSKHFPGLYKCVVTKQTSFYYRVNMKREEIEVVTFFDNRQTKKVINYSVPCHFNLKLFK